MRYEVGGAVSVASLDAGFDPGGTEICARWNGVCGFVGYRVRSRWNRALKVLLSKGPILGLDLHLDKCELISTLPSVSQEDHVGLAQLFPQPLLADGNGSPRVKAAGCFEFLGSAIGSDTFCTGVVHERVHKTSQLLDLVSQLDDPQVALKLQRHAVNYGRVMYCMRTCPPHQIASALEAFDKKQLQCLEAVLGTHLSQAQWAQASRSTSAGELGLRQAAEHAAPAFLASCTASVALCRELDGAFNWDTALPTSNVQQALAALSARTMSTETPTLPLDLNDVVPFSQKNCLNAWTMLASKVSLLPCQPPRRQRCCQKPSLVLMDSWRPFPAST